MRPDSAPRGGNLADWLDWQMHVHSQRIELGLERVHEVADRLGILPLDARRVVIAGTNGKGSCAHLTEALLHSGGRSVGMYTSPHLWRYNERVRINGTQAGDDALCAAFEAVETARGQVSLTYFEFGTLAALWLFQRAGVDYAVLEVGLGGRLDAVNIVDADVALITNIGMDHAAYLGNTREAIGREKAGIMRSGKPVVCADRDLPASVSEHAEQVGAQMYCIGKAFDIQDHQWQGWAGQNVSWDVSLPAYLLADNLAASLAVVELLGESPGSEVPEEVFSAQQTLRGRREITNDGAVPIIYDVGHNAEAIAVLAAYLRDNPVSGATHLILGMLSDKPVEAVAGLLAPLIDFCYTANLATVSDRGIDDKTLAARVCHDAQPAGTPSAALTHVRAQAQPGDRIVVCGSFHTVAQAIAGH